jgi:ubiquinone biosynthesis protein COQ4
MMTTARAFASADAGRASAVLSLPAPPPERPVEWRRAVRALRELLADPDQTQKAFEVFLALDGGHSEPTFQRLLAQPQGARLAAERPCLLRRLSDRAALAALPADSFGRAYLAYLDRTGFAPDGLVKLKAEMEAYAESIGERLLALDATREWFRERGILMHDLWHVLTDYSTDGLGEAALLAFSCAQMPGRANRLLLLGAGLRGAGEAGIGFAAYLYRAWRRGRRAAWLAALPYEELLDQPLEAVRRLARIEPASLAHPGGILRDSV